MPTSQAADRPVAGGEDEHGDDRHGKQEVDHVVGDDGKGKDVAREVDFLDQVAVVADDGRRQEHRGLKPRPGEEGGNQDELIVLHLDPDDLLEGEVENQPQQQGLEHRPDEAENGVLVSEL